VSSIAFAVLPAEYTTAADILRAGGVAACLLVALIVIYKDGQRKQERLEELMVRQTDAQKQHAVATAKYSEAIKDQSAATHRMADAVNQMVQSCREAKGLPVKHPAEIAP
jgi:hypothetical protein